jgi:hypothetical protein
MKKIPFKLIVLAGLVTMGMTAQRFETPLQEYKVSSDAEISIEASYAEIEIEEWSKNKVEIQGVMDVQGLPQDEAESLFNSWDISTQAVSNKITIRSISSNYGNEYFFINNDKYLGNVVIDIPEISGMVVDILDSMNFVLPEFENFPDFDFNMNPNFRFNEDSIAFDYEEFKKNGEYLKEWQERNKEQLYRLKKELKENQAEIAIQQKEIQQEVREAQKEVQKEMKQVQKEIQEEIKQAQKEMKKEMYRAQLEAKTEIERNASEREHEVRRIMNERQKVKVKKTLVIKVPKNAKLEFDVDYCKISTVN